MESNIFDPSKPATELYQQFYDGNVSVSITATFNSTWKTFIPPFSTFDIGLVAIIILSMAVLGLIANSITIVVIRRSPNLMKCIFNHYLISLCVSDSLSALISPLLLYRRTWGFTQWKIPHFLCKVYWAGDLSTSITTSLHILLFCALRWLSMLKPHSFSRIKIVHAQISIFFLWIISIVFGSFTYGLWMKVLQLDRKTTTRNGEDCSISYDGFVQFKTFLVFGSTIFFYIPLLGVIILSSAITFLLCRRRSKRKQVNKSKVNQIIEVEIIQQKKEHQAIAQLILIVISHFIGYIPMSEFFMSTVFKFVASNIDSAVLKWRLGISTYICMRFSECLNPVLYNVGSSKLRTETENLLRKWFKCKNKIHGNQISTLHLDPDPGAKSVKAATKNRQFGK